MNRFNFQPHREKQIGALIVMAYIVLATVFSLSPIFEGGDELQHYSYVRHVAQTLSLPDPYTGTATVYPHAPLYYMLASPVAMIFPARDFDQLNLGRNPFYPYQFNVPGNDNKNFFLHHRSESFPYTDSETVLAIHMIRLFSIVIGLGTVLTSYAIFRLLWPNRPDRRLFALSAVAFMPQFLYVSSTIHNDNLLYLTVTLSFWILLLIMRDGISWRKAVLLGVALGAAFLTKVQAVALIVPFGTALLLKPRLWRFIPLLLIIIVVTGGWWYIRNAVLYGDLINTQAWIQSWGTGSVISREAFTWEIEQARLPFAYETFWARFGGGQIPVGQRIYDFFNILTFITIAGLTFQVARYSVQAVRAGKSVLVQDYPRLRYAAIVVSFGFAWLGLLVYLVSTAWSNNQGRYLLPCIAIWAVWISYGLDAWTPLRFRWPITFVGILLLLGIAAICLFGYFLPAFQVLPVPAKIEHPLSFRYGDVAELIGTSPAISTARPGDLIHINLYWRALRPASSTLMSFVHTIGSDVVRRDSFPGTGNLLASDWQVGDMWTERYLVEIPSNAELQTVTALTAGLYDSETQYRLTAEDASGKEVYPVIGQLVIPGTTQPPIDAVYHLGDIAMAEPLVERSGNTLNVCLKMQLQGEPITENYTMFIHALPDTNPSTPTLYQTDVQPRRGTYPTMFWQRNEVIEDCIPFEVGSDPVEWLALGLYNSVDGQRLPVKESSDYRILIEGK